MHPDPHVVPAVWATPELPGIGGVIKQRPEDFLVEEIPLYPPDGAGEHIYLYIEKRNMSTFELVDAVRKHFGVKRSAVGYAGLKDKVAITRQTLSVHTPGKRPEDFPSFEHERASVLWVDLHRNKLRRGHLKGNGFSIRVRNVSPTDALPAKRVLERLGASGVPNRIGEQRFGKLQNNHLVGAALVLGRAQETLDLLLGPSELSEYPHARDAYSRGEYREAFEYTPRHLRTERDALLALSRGRSPEDTVAGIGPHVGAFFLSAFQSSVFNELLDDRLRAGALDTLDPGDVAMRHDNRALFDVDDAVTNDPTTRDRLDAFEISPSGPMWGASMKRASGATDRAERAALEETGVSLGDLERFAATSDIHMEGARRPYRVPVANTEIEGGMDEHGGYVRCKFELPRGSFATVVMREIMKPDILPGDENDDE